MNEEVKYPDGATKVLDHGFVRLIDSMGNDQAIIDAARVSYAKGTKRVNSDEGLIRYLMRHGHTTPFEMVEFLFHARMPIFVARQWVRHRTASLNETSLRYSEAEDLFYVPESKVCTKQSKTNRQGENNELVQSKNEMPNGLKIINKLGYEAYQVLLRTELRRELARIVLPATVYTSWYWKIDAKNLLHFLQLRTSNHAQYEIRVYALAMLELIKPIIPITIKAWEDYYINSIKLSDIELKAITEQIYPFTLILNLAKLEHQIPNKRERNEFIEKVKKIFPGT